MKRILVTGATGFIGRPCIDLLLEDGFDVHAISSQAELPNLPKIVWHPVDLHDHSGVKQILARVRPAFLLHSAWYVKHGDHWSSKENLRWVSSSLHLAEEFIKHGGEKLVCLGTCAEYDWNELPPLKSIYEESRPLRPHTIYGASKASLFMMLEALCKNEDIDFVWARPFGPYGFYDNPKRLIPHTVLSLLQGEIMICNNPEFVRNFTFVNDIAQILVQLLQGKTLGAINIANGQAVKLKYVVEFVAKAVGAENLVQYRPNSANGTEPAVLVADVKKLKDEIGHVAPTSLEDGLERSIGWWREKLGMSQKSIVSIGNKFI